MGDSYVERSTPSREVADMQSLATHEIGHKIGLAHVSPEEDPHSIMNPSLYIGEGLANRKLSRGDIERIQKIYGCEGAACDIEKTFLKIEALKWQEEELDSGVSTEIAQEVSSSSSEEMAH